MNDNNIVLNEKNIDRLHPDFYKVFFGHYANVYYDAVSRTYFHPVVYRYVKKTDIYKIPDFYKALMEYEKSIKNQNIISTLSPMDNLIYSNKLVFVPSFWNSELKPLFEVKTACKNMLEIAKKHKINFYKKNELRKVMIQDFQLQK